MKKLGNKIITILDTKIKVEYTIQDKKDIETLDVTGVYVGHEDITELMHVHRQIILQELFNAI